MNSLLKKLVNDIKAKKELSSLDDSFVEGFAKGYLEKNPIELKEGLTEKQVSKSKEYKGIIKDVRKQLRAVYGVFKEGKFGKRLKLINDIKGLDDFEGHSKILALHKSTKERLPYYETVYDSIFKVTGKPKTILDLGCGLNPFSYPWMKINVKYVAVEAAEEDVKFIQSYFDSFGINGKALKLDLSNVNVLPKADVCFLFKMLDTLEGIRRGISGELIEKIDSRFIVASFPTKSLGAKKEIRAGRLGWFEKIIEAYEYTIFEIENEKFYIIRK